MLLKPEFLKHELEAGDSEFHLVYAWLIVGTVEKVTVK
jgi:hypothetical protein